ncbi:MAG: hypothetical protein N3G76_01015 [Candidatus Micrarchaeota archaeon]|nr:hypothetical protein [Candidatus Micrarchaeota archaeon]
MQERISFGAQARKTAQSTLSDFGAEAHFRKADVRDILNSLRTAPSDMRGEMWMELLRKGHGKDVFRTLLISKSDQPLKMEALMVIPLMGDEGVHIMKEAFRKSDSWTRSQLVGVFAFLERKDLVMGELVQAVDDRHITMEKRMAALEAIIKSPARYEGTIVHLLDSKDPAVRSRIASTIGNRKLLLGKEKLKRMLLEEKDLGVLYSIIEALNQLGENITVEEVMNMRDGTLQQRKSMMRKMREISKKLGARIYAFICGVVAVLLSFGYAISSIISLLNTIIKNPSQIKLTKQEREGNNDYI